MPPIISSLIKQSNSADDRTPRNGQLTGGSHRQELADNALRSLSSSASKPPPTHPILKKARGPSTTGPRPTARFLSPHDSPDEDAKEPEIPSSGSVTATSTVSKTANTPSPAKKRGQHTKRFVASTANKRRPILPPRRGSSQNSIHAESSSRETTSSVASSRTPESQRAISPIAEANITDTVTASPTCQEKPVLSAKAAGKRPVLPRRLTAEKKAAKSNGSVSPLLRSAVHDQAARELALTQPQSPIEMLPPAAELSRPSVSTRSATSPDATRRPSVETTRPAIAPSMGRSQSHTGYERFRSSLSGASHTPGLFTGATASTTNVAAQGTIIDQSGLGSLPPISSFHGMDGLNGTLVSRGSSTSLLEPRFTPTQPSTSASVPLARTKSQLTLLLEREKERVGFPSKR